MGGDTFGIMLLLTIIYFMWLAGKPWRDLKRKYKHILKEENRRTCPVCGSNQAWIMQDLSRKNGKVILRCFSCNLEATNWWGLDTITRLEVEKENNYLDMAEQAMVEHRKRKKKVADKIAQTQKEMQEEEEEEKQQLKTENEQGEPNYSRMTPEEVVKDVISRYGNTEDNEESSEFYFLEGQLSEDDEDFIRLSEFDKDIYGEKDSGEDSDPNRASTEEMASTAGVVDNGIIGDF